MSPTVDEHAETVARLLAPLAAEPTVESVPLSEARGRVTASDVRSEVDLPLFRNSQMDGFAVRAADVAHAPVALEVAGDIPAGHAVAVTHAAGTAIRIMTGAPMPDGADAVIPVEDTELVLGRDDDLRGAVVEIRRPRRRGEYVRERGSDVHRGEVLVPAGTRLAPRHLAALAAAGVRSVPVRSRLRVGILTTGSELVTDGGPAAFGQIFDANGVALAALVEEAGAVVSSREASDDDPATFGRLLDAAVAVSDLVITSGGISQGAYEVVREVLEPRGAVVTTVAMQPGGPQATAVVDGVPVFCFPGNPVSTQVSFVVFLRGPLREAAGLPPVAPSSTRLAEPVRSVPGKRQFLRARSAEGAVTPVSGPSSHLVAAMARADVLIDMPAEVESLPAGADVTVWTL
ncbi:gephyrin-like molybdotransferase Glp [Leifsonia aquatica]|uniref:Molybdopterin molybdenumtransferase n=3 Tax=Leifsonia aquatica TaxID=144185 RepID=A0A7W4YH60_LEIAQ|nr:gephyrin-like molybdotransferase Glp [Leifsonia aquatica]MBB2965888.1 molybdopterin molybdotransferase [Leifsonia aquatica]